MSGGDSLDPSMVTCIKSLNHGLGIQFGWGTFTAPSTQARTIHQPRLQSTWQKIMKILLRLPWHLPQKAGTCCTNLFAHSHPLQHIPTRVCFIILSRYAQSMRKTMQHIPACVLFLLGSEHEKDAPEQVVDPRVDQVQKLQQYLELLKHISRLRAAQQLVLPACTPTNCL